MTKHGAPETWVEAGLVPCACGEAKNIMLVFHNLDDFAWFECRRCGRAAGVTPSKPTRRIMDYWNSINGCPAFSSLGDAIALEAYCELERKAAFVLGRHHEIQAIFP